jgi:amidase
MREHLDAFASATAMLRALHARDVSAVELLDLHAKRIERYNGPLNAVVTRDFERARDAAIETDGVRARGGGGALLGLPLTVKDAIDVQGLPSTAGRVDRVNHRAIADGPLVARVRAAGGIVMGKTNVPTNLAHWQTDNPLFGRTNNPWNLERSPGGSSGGSAAALATGLTPLEFGSDLGGSIRYPAAWSGVYGHMPSSTVVPRTGHFPGSSLPNPAIPLGMQGPLARSADDLALALDVVAGPETGEEVAWRLALPPARHQHLSAYRVAIFPSASWRPVHQEIAAALDALASGLSRAGAHVEQATPELVGDGFEHHVVLQMLLSAITRSGLPPAERAARVDMHRASGDLFGEARARGIEATVGEYIGLHTRREQYRAAWRAFFRDWDVLLAPVVMVPAPPHTTESQETHTFTVDDQTANIRTQVAYCGLATLSGLPATAFPIGLTRGGLPIGIQAIGPYLEDHTSITFARRVADAFGGFQQPPGYAASF